MQLGGTEEIEGEGINVPGDDDGFSYVSAPASDYSVTTAGSDFMNSSTRSVEDVTQQLPPPVQEQPAAAAVIVEPEVVSSPSAVVCRLVRKASLRF